MCIILQCYVNTEVFVTYTYLDFMLKLYIQLQHKVGILCM